DLPNKDAKTMSQVTKPTFNPFPRRACNSCCDAGLRAILSSAEQNFVAPPGNARQNYKTPAAPRILGRETRVVFGNSTPLKRHSQSHQSSRVVHEKTSKTPASKLQNSLRAVLDFPP